MRPAYSEYHDQPERTQRIGHCLFIEDDAMRSDMETTWLDTPCDVVLLDRKTGAEHQAYSVVPLDPDDSRVVQGYFMFWHYCGCHRVGSIKGEEPETKGSCPANRFTVKSTTHPRYPGLNLYYETPIGEFVGENE